MFHSKKQFFYFFKKEFKIIFWIIFFCSFCFSIKAGEWQLLTEDKEIRVGKEFKVELVSRNQEAINAAQGEIFFSKETLELEKIYETNSIFPFWIEKPSLIGQDKIKFSGIIPGGFRGERGLVLTLVFKAIREGKALISLSDSCQAFLNDGQGTQTNLTLKNLEFEILPFLSSDSESKIAIESEDKTPPEIFIPQIVSFPYLFDGKWVLIFNAQDKETGIDYYEILETRGKENMWVRAESPYLIKDQNLKSDIYVKAVDKAGNERIVFLKAPHPVRWYEKWWIWGIIILIVCFLFVLLIKFKKMGKSLIENRKIFTHLFLLLITFTLPYTANGAFLYFLPSSGNFSTGQTFTASLYVSSPNQTINAIGEEIYFSNNKLEVVSLSKANSIVTNWVREPSFSNSSGRINFDGVVINGFKGEAGKVMDIILRAKNLGEAEIGFRDAMVLAHDGLGTNVLKEARKAVYKIEGEKGLEVANTPPAPKIYSPTHPDSESWYSNNNPILKWEVPPDIIGVRLLYDHLPDSTPTVFYSEPISEKKLTNLSDGIWYFHAQLKNQAGWGKTSHFKFQIDRTPPDSFVIEKKYDEKDRYILSYVSKDELSGIDYYEIVIGEKTPIKTTETEYKIPILPPGDYKVIVRAVDKAGNSTSAETEIKISELKAPVIKEYQKELIWGEDFSIKGEGPEGSIIEIYLNRDGKTKKIGEVTVEKEGQWRFDSSYRLPRGISEIFAVAVHPVDARSAPSNSIFIYTKTPTFIKIGNITIDYIAAFLTLLILIIVLALFISWLIIKVLNKRKRLKKETLEVRLTLTQAFQKLQKDIEKEINKLDGKSELSEREKEVYKNLKEMVDFCKKTIAREIKDIEKELK